MKSREFMFHMTWAWLWLMTTIVCVEWMLSEDTYGLIAVVGLFLSGVQAGVQGTVLGYRLTGVK